MDYKRKANISLVILLFILSVSTTIIPSGAVATYGMFGEIKTSTVVQERQVGVEQVASLITSKRSEKGANVINLWFELLIIVCYLSYISYQKRLGRKETIVTLKVRMDD